jgi:hypothetical protein
MWTLIVHYLESGFEHVIPWGYDHILFIICLFFYAQSFKSLVIQCTVFTLAHSISLLLAALGVFESNPLIIEPLISLSILFAALDNILQTKLRRGRILLIFLFGLIHGMGFAAAFAETQLPQAELLTALLSFNVGVEIGQLCVILLAFVSLAYWFQHKLWYRTRIVLPISFLAGCLALYWTIIRLV